MTKERLIELLKAECNWKTIHIGYARLVAEIDPGTIEKMATWLLPLIETRVPIDGEVDRIAGAWPFDVVHYPGLETVPPRDRLAASLRHILLHLVKDAGRMAAAIEREDHGELVDLELLRRPVRNALVNALRLCQLLGLRPSELLAEYLAEVSS